jgi:hypothetical protein
MALLAAGLPREGNLGGLLRVGCEGRQDHGEGEDESDGAAVHGHILQKIHEQIANMRRLGHECSPIDPLGQRDTVGIGAQRSLMVFIAYGHSRMFSGCS